jgi:Zn-dependent peptidase ImmA (M78 family)
VALEEIPSAAAWLDASLDGPLFTPTQADDDRWFDQRHEYWRRHALPSIGGGACWPNVTFRRVGEHVEVSWENDDTTPPRGDLRFMEPRGSVLVPADIVASTLRQCVMTAIGKLRERSVPIGLAGPLANGHGAGHDAWKWLVAPSVRDVLLHAGGEIRELRGKLEQNVPRHGALVPHTPLTSWLRAAPLSDSDSIVEFGHLTSTPPPSMLAQDLLSLRSSTPAPAEKPWRAGYTAALRVREALGWNDEAVPDLSTWLPTRGIALENHSSGTGWMCAVCTFEGHRARIVDNSAFASVSRPMRLASGLGHLLLDLPEDKSFGVVSSPWAHWPTVARAKAFGAMLLIPEGAVRAIARTVTDSTELARRIIERFHVTPKVATWHLYHLGLLGEDEREQVLLNVDQPVRSTRSSRPD